MQAVGPQQVQRHHGTWPMDSRAVTRVDIDCTAFDVEAISAIYVTYFASGGYGNAIVNSCCVPIGKIQETLICPNHQASPTFAQQGVYVLRLHSHSPR